MLFESFLAFFQKPNKFAVPSAEPLDGEGLAGGRMAGSICLMHSDAAQWIQGGTRFAFPRNVFPRLDSISIGVSGYTTAAMCCMRCTDGPFGAC